MRNGFIIPTSSEVNYTFSLNEELKKKNLLQKKNGNGQNKNLKPVSPIHSHLNSVILIYYLLNVENYTISFQNSTYAS